MSTTNTTTAKNLIPAAAYVRMSTDDQQDSPARQRQDIEALACRGGYTVTTWYEDHGKTGTESKKRPEFQQMLKAAQAGKFKVLLLSEQSRMSREDLFGQIAHWKVMKDAGVSIVTCQQGELNFNNLGGLITAIVGAHGAHDESRKIADRVVSGRRLAASRGRRLGGAVFGYDREVRDERGELLRRVHFRERFKKPQGCSVSLVPSADHQAVFAVRHAFDCIAAGQLIADVMRWFHEHDVRSVRGNPFLNGDLRRILTNPVCAGTLQIGQGSGRRSKFFRAFDEVKLIPNAHEPLVDRELFDKVQSILRNRHQRRTRAEAGRYLLSGIVHCGHCGRKMHGVKWRTKPGSKDYATSYTCSDNSRDSNPNCPHPSIKGAYVENVIVKMIRDKVLSKANRVRIAERMSTRGKKTNRKSVEQDRLAELQADIARGEKNLTRAETDADYAAIARNLREWREEAERLNTKIRSVAATTAPDATATAAIARLEWLRDNFEKASRPKLADCLKQVVQRIEVRRVQLGTYGDDNLTSWTATIYFAPDLHAEPIVVTGEEMSRFPHFKKVLDFLRDSDRPVLVKDILAAVPMYHGTVKSILVRGERMGLVERAGLVRGCAVLWQATDAEPAAQPEPSELAAV